LEKRKRERKEIFDKKKLPKFPGMEF